jgi:hypothetical protein
MATATRTIREPEALRMLMDNIDADIARRLDDLHPVTRPFPSLCHLADVFGALEREASPMPAREERAC